MLVNAPLNRIAWSALAQNAFEYDSLSSHCNGLLTCCPSNHNKTYDYNQMEIISTLLLFLDASSHLSKRVSVCPSVNPYVQPTRHGVESLVRNRKTKFHVSFEMPHCISVSGYVRLSVGPFVGPSIHQSIGQSVDP